MPSLIERVRRTIDQHALLPPGSRVLVGLSGGADSVALTVLLHELAPAGGFSLAGLAHVHHGLRGRAADEDETFCRALAGRLALPIAVDHVDVRALARKRHLSIEEAGRDARYRFFEQAAASGGADRVAVGHTLEDQAETLLLNLIRGAGLRGLSGIRPRNGAVIRPLLDVRHDELRAYLRTRGVEFREDDSNRDTALLRNRVRHELLPLLEAHYSPGVVEVLARSAAIARDDEAFLAREADGAWDRVVRTSGVRVELDAAVLALEPPALAGRVALRALTACADGKFVGGEHVGDLLALAGTALEPASCDLPGQRAEKRGGRIVLTPRMGPGRGRRAPAAEFRYTLPVPGTTHVEEARVTISAERAPRLPEGGFEALCGSFPGRVAVVDGALVPGPLTIRSRKAGDAFRPLGLSGRKKLQDYFVDRKIARADRDRVPLVVDAQDRIIWVAGHASSGDFRVTAPAAAVVILKMEGGGDPA